MKRLFQNKILIILLLAVLLFYSTASPAYAFKFSFKSWGLSMIINIISILTIGIPIAPLIMHNSNIWDVVGGIPGGAIGCLTGQNGAFWSGCGGGGQQGVGVTIIQAGGACQSIPITFYNPQYNTNYSTGTSTPGWKVVKQSCDNDGNCTTIESVCQPNPPVTTTFSSEESNSTEYCADSLNGPLCGSTYANCQISSCSSTPSNDNQGTVTLYRFSIDKNVSAGGQGANDRICQLFGDIDCDGDSGWARYKGYYHNIGNGFTNINTSELLSKLTDTGGSDISPWSLQTFTFPASQACNGSTCTFNDTTFPANSYVVYAAKINGSFTSQSTSGHQRVYSDDNGTSYGPCVPGTPASGEQSCALPAAYCDASSGAKLLSKDTNYPRLPNLWSGYWGNSAIGPIETPASTTCPPPALQTTASIQANGQSGSITIPYNTSANITWASNNADACTITTGSGSFGSGISGTKDSGNLIQTTTYSLSCAVTVGNAMQAKAGDAVTVNVSPQIPVPQAQQITASIQANGQSGSITIPYNTSANITWASNNADACTVSPPGWTSASETSGKSTGNLTSPQTYVLNCTGAGGTAASNVTVNVSSQQQQGQGQGLIQSFLPTPSSVKSGQSSTLSWSTVNATSCYIDNGIGTVAVNDSRKVTPATTTTYILTCKNSTQTTSSKATVVVNVPPPPVFKEVLPQ